MNSITYTAFAWKASRKSIVITIPRGILNSFPVDSGELLIVTLQRTGEEHHTLNPQKPKTPPSTLTPRKK